MHGNPETENPLYTTVSCPPLKRRPTLLTKSLATSQQNKVVNKYNNCCLMIQYSPPLISTHYPAYITQLFVFSHTVTVSHHL